MAASNLSDKSFLKGGGYVLKIKGNVGLSLIYFVPLKLFLVRGGRVLVILEMECNRESKKIS